MLSIRGWSGLCEGSTLYREGLSSGRRSEPVIPYLTLPGGMGGKDALKKLIDIDAMVTAMVSSGYAGRDYEPLRLRRCAQRLAERSRPLSLSAE